MARLVRWAVRAMGFHVHDWKKWEAIGDLKRSDTKAIIGQVQRRECKTCGKAQVDQLWFC